MSKKLIIWNEFGETPKTSFTAAGVDFMIPHLVNKSETQRQAALKAFEKSFDVTDETVAILVGEARRLLIEKIGDAVLAEQNIPDTLHLFLALDSIANRNHHNTLVEKLQDFCEHRLLYDKKKNAVGLWLDFGDQMKINSGIHEALPHEFAGVYLNKSGMGNKGFDVRSQVIDEDYTGIVHLSISFCKDMKSPVIYAGDKVIQQLIIPIYLVDMIEEVSEEDYKEIMKDSNRGDQGFGSQDVKHE